MGNARENFIDYLKDIFPIEAPNPEAFEEELVLVLSAHNDRVLTDAAKSIVKGRKYKTFPSIRECIDACAQQVDPAVLKKSGEDIGRPGSVERAVWAEGRAKRSRLWPTACNEGWSLSLCRHFEDHPGQEPSPQDIVSFKQASEGFVAEVEALAHRKDPTGKALYRLGNAMLARREAHQRMNKISDNATRGTVQ